VLVADPRFLGLLRHELDAHRPPGAAIKTLGSDLSWHNTARIEDTLREHGLLAMTKLPTQTYRPRGQPPPRGT
jgi:hypothetical protein